MAERQYALVHAGELVNDSDGNPVISGFCAEAPDGFASFYPAESRWVPVENRDTRSFDIKAHWRDAPRYEAHGDCVHRVYEVHDIRRRA